MNARIIAALSTYAEAMANAQDEFVATLAELAGEDVEETPAPAAKKAVPAKKAAPAAKKTAPPAKKTTPAKKAVAKPAPEPEPEEDEEAERIAELEAMPLAALRALAIKRGFDEAEVKKEKDKSVLAMGIYADQIANPDDADDDADEETEADEEEAVEVQYDRDALKGMNLRQLRALAKESGIDAADLRGQDADSIVDLILGGDDEEEAAADEDEEPMTEEELREMSPAQLKVLCKDWGVAVKRGMTADEMVEALMDKAEEEDADEEE